MPRPNAFALLISLISASALLIGCDVAEDQVMTPSSATPSLAPLAGKADGTDSSDRDCHVVLRSVWRAPGPTGYEVDCTTGHCWFVWEGTLDVSETALDLGAEPFLLYRAGLGSWWEVGAAPVDGAAEGYQRFHFRLAEETLPAGMSGTAFVRATIELIPFVRINGMRHFDHNRKPGDLDNYVLTYAGGFAIEDEPAVCSPVPAGIANIEMRLGWTIARRGALVAGGSLVLDYDIGRLPECRGTNNGYPTWNVVAHARFLPGDEQVATSIRAYDYHQGTPLSTGYSVPATIRIPTGATGVEMWFENFNGAGDDCRAWDSNLGNNYRFDVLPSPPPAVGWAGDLGNGFNRQCEHVHGLSEPMTIGSWEMQRTCLFFDGDVWIPGLTDSEESPDYVLAKARFAIDGGEEEDVWLYFAGRVGNNYRYRWDLPRERLMRSEWSEISWAMLFSTDGIEWYRVGLGDGPEGGAPRTIVNAD